MRPQYSSSLESAIGLVCAELRAAYAVRPRALALLLLQGDSEVEERVREAEGAGYAAVAEAVRLGRQACPTVSTAIAVDRHLVAQTLLAEAVTQADVRRDGFADRLSSLCLAPATGLPILIIALYLGLYLFVGRFGGVYLVDLLQNGLFGQRLNPWMVAHFEHWVPWPWLRDLFVGEYGMWTLGMTYAVALILPIVGTFFLAFSVLEDTGYFPRLAMLIDRLFKRIGLSGKAVIPIVLGFGCDTMATIVTRILETRRERMLATFLLALAIPCSAQLGVMAALLAGHPLAFALWGAVMLGVFLGIGWAAARLVPGEPARFALELPPMRLPRIGNIFAKTTARMQWYFLEVLPLFLVASVFIWLGKLSGLFGVLVSWLVPLVRVLGLPDGAAPAFLFGFFRRDYGAAGLYRLHEGGGLTGVQLLVSVVTLTIFLPCIAQFLMIRKERGTRAAVGMAAFIVPFALVVGAALNAVLHALRVTL